MTLESSGVRFLSLRTVGNGNRSGPRFGKNLTVNTEVAPSGIDRAKTAQIRARVMDSTVDNEYAILESPECPCQKLRCMGRRKRNCIDPIDEEWAP